LQNLRPLACVQSNYKKRRRDMLLFQNVENLWCPSWIWTVIKRNRQLFRGGSKLVNVVRNREALVVFTREKVRSGIVCEIPYTSLRLAGELPNVPIALQNQIGPGRHILQLFAQSIVRVRRIPNFPKRGIRGAEAPHCGSLHAESLTRAQLVVRRNRVQKPYL